MSMQSNAGTRRGPHLSNPLSLFGLFVTLCQVTVGVAAVQASGWVQGLFAIFAVAFPLLVLAAFFTILWHRPETLYPPGEYTKETSVADFAKAMRRITVRQEETLESTVRDVAGQVARSESNGPVNQSKKVETAVRDAKQRYRRQLLEVELSNVDEELATKPFATSVTSKTTVTDVLDLIYFAISDYVPPFAYGRDWVPIDTSTGKRMADLGRAWAHRHNYEEDFRPAETVGLRAGAPLAVRLLKRNLSS
jgi:hypothetical protein